MVLSFKWALGLVDATGDRKWMHRLHAGGGNSRSMTISRDHFRVTRGVAFMPLSASLLPPLPTNSLHLLTIVQRDYELQYRIQIINFQSDNPTCLTYQLTKCQGQLANRFKFPAVQRSSFPMQRHQSIYQFSASCVSERGHKHSGGYLHASMHVAISTVYWASHFQ